MKNTNSRKTIVSKVKKSVAKLKAAPKKSSAHKSASPKKSAGLMKELSKDVFSSIRSVLPTSRKSKSVAKKPASRKSVARKPARMKVSGSRARKAA